MERIDRRLSNNSDINLLTNRNMGDMRFRGRKTLLCLLLLAVIVLFAMTSFPRGCEVPLYLRHLASDNELPTIYAITPTYARAVQKAELTRLSHLVMLVRNLHWIIVEDANYTSSLVANLLETAGLTSRSTLLAAPTPAKFKLRPKDQHWIYARGVDQRNAGLQWLRKHTDSQNSGLVYFMDDDNAYSIELFRQMSLIKRSCVGVWPVGLVGGLKVEKPIVKDKVVIGFNSMWHPERPFPIDMAGFAISLDLIHGRPEAQFSYDVQRGYQESEILRHLTTMQELQPLAKDGTQVLVWHTRTETPKFPWEQKLQLQGKRSDDRMEM